MKYVCKERWHYSEACKSFYPERTYDLTDEDVKKFKALGPSGGAMKYFAAAEGPKEPPKAPVPEKK
jgi:hypothetical protein